MIAEEMARIDPLCRDPTAEEGEENRISKTSRQIAACPPKGMIGRVRVDEACCPICCVASSPLRSP